MTADKVRLLIVQANPPDMAPLGSDVEQRKLDEVLQLALGRQHFAVLPPLLAARVGDIQRALRRHRPHILHFIGHGDGKGGLLLNAPDDSRKAVLSAEAFADLIGAYQAESDPSLQVVVLVGCRTAPTAERLAAHVACAIGTSDDIGDLAVRDAFTPGFYAALGDGRSVGNALASAQAEMRSQGYGADAAMVVCYPQAGVAVDQLVPARWLQAHTALSQAHLDYLRSWFGQPWTTVSLADIQSERNDQAHLLDLYVPLPVDCTLVIKTEDHRIVDWWVKQEVAGEEQAAPGQPSGKVFPKLRRWVDLGVGEAELQQIVEGIQAKIETRRAAGEETKDGEHTWYMEAHDAASVQPRFVLLGDPGSGKSSFLRHLTLCLAGALRRRAGDAGTPANANLAALRDWLLGAYTPIYIEMRSLVRDAFPALPADANSAERPFHEHPIPNDLLPTAHLLWDYVRKQLLGPGLASFEAELRTLVGDGKAILLLDGLDEIPQADDDRRRQQVKAFVASLVNTYANLCMIAASRPHAYQADKWALAGFGHARLQPLGLDRLQELAQALFTVAQATPPQPSPAWGGSHAVPPPTWGRAGGGDEAATFVQALRNHPHMEPGLHANPLFFTLLAALWLAHPERQLPATQAELYRAAVDLLLDRWTRRRDPEGSVADKLGVNTTELRQVLETLACTVQEQSKPNEDTTRFHVRELLGVLFEAGFAVALQDIPSYLERHAGLLVSPSRGYFYFSHRSFQEHLAACELTCREPEKHHPPVAPDRHYPDGLIRRVQEAPALWENVAHLAADELITQGREGQTLLWELLDDFCQPYMEQVTQDTAGRAALIALRIAHRHDLFNMNKADRRYRRDLEPLRQVALQVLVDSNHFTPAARDIAGQLLGRRPEHDTRKGVGRRADGLPDIDWAPIPETDAQGQREFIYQEDERRSEPTFWIARYPITCGQFQAFLDADDGFANPAWREGLAASKPDRAAPGTQRFEFWNHPRENVSWYDAMAFCRWLTARAQARPDLLPAALQGQTGWRITLPTEWQWEKAARGHDGRQYPWGGSQYISGYANIDETYQKGGPHYLQKTSAVGMYPQGASPYDVLDMSGNVWEQCLNEYSDPDRIQEVGDARRVVRGGSWLFNSSNASALRRDYWDLRYYLGFRVVVGVVGFVPVL